MLKSINCLKYGIKITIISFLFILIGYVLTFMTGGYNFGIDFSPGVKLDLLINKSELNSSEIKDTLSQIFKTFSVTDVDLGKDKNKSGFSIIVKSKTADYVFKSETQAKITTILSEFYKTDVEVMDSYFIDSNFSSILRIKSLLLICGTLFLILFYVSLRFKFSYALAAIFATLHDVMFVTAFLGVFKIEINSSIVVAVLTIIGYSLNDTIIIFDRIRDNLKNSLNSKLEDLIDLSIKKTLSRTILTSLTTFIAVFSIYIFTEGNIKDFSLVFMVGVIVGTYSSIFVASPIFLYFYKRIK